MAWTLTDDAEAHAMRVWDLLAADPVAHTVALTVLEGARSRPGDALFASWEDGGTVRGAASLTPPYELLLSAAPEEAVEPLAAALRERGADVPGVNGEPALVERFAAAWTAGTPLRTRVAMRKHLQVLRTPTTPEPPPAGRARLAHGGERDLVVGWMRAFWTEAGVTPVDPAPAVDEPLADDRLWLWEDPGGEPAALAGRGPAVAGVARITAVYTPPPQRRRGYAAGVTAACCANALARGAEGVVLFTDDANPTASAVYRRIGFRPLSAFAVLRFDA